ncbi:MAG: DUF58 domain-containing protein [Bacteroidia bacterium]|jgi:uncharacterized protein (DUF58 family)|nr:DUF58 domain-containing protein [Bacteroidia bacterium]
MTKLSPEQLLPAGNLELLASQVVEGFITGLHKSPFHGFSVEFAEHRLYNTGESTKHIDWKLYARTDKLFVKRYEEETNLRCQLVIDTSGSMYYPEPNFNKIKFSVEAAAAMMLLMRKQRDASGLTLFNEDITFHSSTKVSVQHMRMLFQKLEEVLGSRSNHSSSIANTLHRLAEMQHRRSLIIIFSDMFSTGENQDELFSALQHLRYNKHEVILFNVFDKVNETEFDFPNRPYLFKDAESGKEIKLFPAQVKAKYLEAISTHKEALKLKCLQYKIDYHEADVELNNTHQLLQAFLVKRARLLK